MKNRIRIQNGMTYLENWHGLQDKHWLCDCVDCVYLIVMELTYFISGKFKSKLIYIILKENPYKSLNSFS